MRPMKLTVSVLCAVLIVCAAAIVLAQDAPYSYMTGFDAARSGVSPDPMKLPLVLSWINAPEIDTDVKTVGAATISPDKVFFPAYRTMFAVDRNTGELAWKLSVGGPIYSTALLLDGVLYFGSDDKMLWAVDASNGNRLWQFPTGGPVRSTPLHVSGVLYFGSDDGRLYALDINSRSLVTPPFQTQGPVRTAPCYYRDTVFVASGDGHLYAISSRGGHQTWRSHLPSENIFASPIIERGKVILASGNQLIAFDTSRGARRWTFTAGGVISGTAATEARRVYVGSHDGVAYCLDSNNGQVIWRFPENGVRRPVSASVGIAEDKVFVLFGKTNLVALSIDRGKLEWEYKFPEPEAQVAAPQPGMGPMDGFPGDPMHPDMGPGGPPMMEMPMGMPGDEGMAPGRPDLTGTRTYSFEDMVKPGFSLSEDSGYMVASGGVLYGFSATAADNVKPEISDALLDVRGQGGMQARFPLMVDDGDTFPGRYADLVQVPGAPPIAISVSVLDTGSGINPASLTMEMDGLPLEGTYDVQQGLLWYTYDPRGAAVSLPNGVRNLVISAADWLGNKVTAQISLTVDNSLEPPGPPQRQQQPGMEFGPGIGPDPWAEPPPGPMF